MRKIKKEVLDIEQKIAIHCKCAKDARELLNIANEMGLRWSSGDSYTDIGNYDEDDHCCYNLAEGLYCDIGFYRTEHFTIYTYGEDDDKIFEGEQMEKEKVLEIEYCNVFEKFAVRIKYQNYDILERNNFRDDELNVSSLDCFHYSGETLYLNGKDIAEDKEFTIMDMDRLEDLIDLVKKINDKYGIPKRWRAKKGGKYFFISGLLNINSYNERFDGTDDELYDLNNYFKTEEEAEIMIEKIKLTLGGK